MKEIHFRILTKFKTPMPLKNAKNFTAVFERDNGGDFEKNNVEILDAAQGEGKISLSDFDIQGLKLNDHASFIIEFDMGAERKRALFAETLTVIMKDERKAIL